MLTTKNLEAFQGGFDSIKDRAAHLVQAMAGVPLEHVVHALVVFDAYNSPGTKSRNAHRWISQFCGFESGASGKAMPALIQVLSNNKIVATRDELYALMADMPKAV